ncbi:MAG: undecaprenyldiphospho-muramoylpentapeptide beta-N-acetylglucosaminyltransferase [Rhizobiales bacterium]|nr:undecaprenyldiphospho-muramoylpentapeptide beta-N-acetylglucosaminyltransferase [Hyphomicrobiales bacterium]
MPRGVPRIAVAAGGTGGHLFPAEALSAALSHRGVEVVLMTDDRGAQYGEKFPASAIHVVPSATVRGHNPFTLARTATMLALGIVKAWFLLGRLKPAAVIGFGGYPTVPPLLAAALRGLPTLIHEQNGVMGRANHLLSGRVTAIATSFPGTIAQQPRLAAKSTRVGNPVRQAVIEAANSSYAVPGSGTFRLLVFGGSQGAQVMADIVPAALAQLAPDLRARLSVVQQARPEDLTRVTSAYTKAGVVAEVASFFPDLPARIAVAHLIVSRSGASTVAELAAVGRPAILVPLPHALDQDQLANAAMLEKAQGAICLRQADFTPDHLAREVSALAANPARLAAMAVGARSAGMPDAAERLADLVLKVARSSR